MKIAMIGIGGIGGYYAARLLHSGQAVTLIARGSQLDALNAEGLTVRHSDWHFHAEVSAMTMESFLESEAAADYDLICLATKAQSTETFAAVLKPWLEAAPVSPVILSLQNGVDNELTLARYLPENSIIGALCIGIGAHITAPGLIESTSAGKITLGVWPRLAKAQSGPAVEHIQSIEKMLNEAAIPTELSDDIQRDLWRKLVINNGVNPLSALTALDTRSLTLSPLFQAVCLGLMQETVIAATADGVTLEPGTAESMLKFIQNFDPIKTSMLVDKEKGRPLELEPICGAVLQRMSVLGKAAPYTQVVYALLKHQEFLTE